MASLNEESSRLATFSDWPIDVPVRPAILARCGFYYTGLDDTVQCYQCSTALRDWRRGDHPLDRHRRTNPDCCIVTNRDTLNAVVHCFTDVSLELLTHRPVSSLEPDDVLRQIVPVINRSNPDDRSWQHLRLNSFRLQTFHDWPKSEIVCASSLARAGFFYTGYGDWTRCAFCKREFTNWQPGDVPTEEHSRGVPTCAFVQKNFCLPTPRSRQLAREAFGVVQHQANDQAQVSRTPEEIRAENRTMRRERLCAICRENEVNRMLPCGHLLCSDCLPHLRPPHCHLCRRPFTDVQPVILSPVTSYI